MDKLNINEVEINGEIYVKKSDIKNENMAEKLDGKQAVMVRTYSAGVFYGYLNKKDGQEVELLEARRVWQWAGAATLSQLAMEGTSSPTQCKFPCTVKSILLTQVIEIIPMTEKAIKSLNSVAIWKQ